MLVGWVVIEVMGLLTVNTTMTTLSITSLSSNLVGLRCMVTTSLSATWPSSLVGSWHAPVVVFGGQWSLFVGCYLRCVSLSLLLGGRGRSLRGCRVVVVVVEESDNVTTCDVIVETRTYDLT
jgi:hypothetical protein